MTTLSLPIYINGRTDLHPGGKVELTGAAEIAATQGGRIPSWSVTWTQTPCRRCGHPPDAL